MKSSIFSLAALSLFPFLGSLAQASTIALIKNNSSLPDCDRGPQSQQLSVRHQEGPGIGFKQGYTTFEGFFSACPSNCEWRPFLDLRGHVFNDGKWAANAGLGLRKLIDSIRAVGGVNIYYDYRSAPHGANFHQIGPGLELLFSKWTVRADGYITAGHKRHLYRAPAFAKFSGHHALFTKKYEQSFQGGDLMISREVFRTRCVDLNATAGGYCLAGHEGKTAAGGLIRLVARITPYLSIEGQASYDNVFKGAGWGSVALNIPFGSRFKLKQSNLTCSAAVRLAERYVEPVPRFEIIAADKYTKKALALNPATGQPINFIFVDNVRGSSDGSFQNPYATLLEAQTNSAPGDFIYVFPGDGTSRGMNQGIILKNNQTFLSSAIPLAVTSAFGPQIIPAQSSGFPTITNLNLEGNTITASNTLGVTIEGFIINGADIGVEASNSSGLIVTKNIFNSILGTAIDGTSSNNAAIIQNTFASVPNVGINGISSTNLLIEQNSFNSPTSLNDPIVGTSSNNFTLTKNAFNAQILTPIDFTGVTNLAVTQNLFTSFASNGLDIINPIGNILIDSNSLTALTGSAILVDSFLNNFDLSITNNQFVSTTPVNIFINPTSLAIPNLINISFNTIQVADNGSALFFTFQNSANVNMSLNNNSLSGGATGINIAMQDSTNLNLTMLSNLVQNTQSHGFLLQNTSSGFLTADLESNQFLDVVQSGTCNATNPGGVAFLLNSSATGPGAAPSILRLLNNSSFTNPLMSCPGFSFRSTSGASNNRFQSPTDTLAGLAAVNPGTNATPAGFVSIGALAFSGGTLPPTSTFVIDPIYPLTCSCPSP